MSTTTVTFEDATPSATEATPRKGLLQWLIKSRERQGEAQVRAVFARMSDHQLADLGFTPEDIGKIRKTGSVPVTYWA